MTAISKERMKIMNRRMTINVMTISLLLSLAPVSHGQPLEGCTTASFSQAAGSPVEVGSGPSLNFSPVEKMKAALHGIKGVSSISYAKGEERPYGNRVYNRTNGISATGAAPSDREI